MQQFIENVMPNVYAYRTRFFDSCEATFQMFLLAGIFSFLLGLFFGMVLTVTKPGGIRQNRLTGRSCR